MRLNRVAVTPAALVCGIMVTASLAGDSLQLTMLGGHQCSGTDRCKCWQMEEIWVGKQLLMSLAEGIVK